MLKRRPLESVGWVNRKALRSGSAMPPRYCQRTSGCISVSLLIGSSTTTSSPARASASTCSCRSGELRGCLGGPSREHSSTLHARPAARSSIGASAKMRIREPPSLEQSFDPSSHGDGLCIAVDESGHLQTERQPVVLQHRKRDRRNAEQ